MSTFSRTAGATYPLWLTTLETVEIDTFARAATRFIVPISYNIMGLDDYVEYESCSRSLEHHSAFKYIAETLIELGLFVRFIGVELVAELSPQPVSAPRPKVTSTTVEKALVDAEQMITQQNPVSAVDRVYTALHGYLIEVCSDAGIGQTTDRLGLTDVVKILREQHPSFSQKKDRDEQLARILKALSAILRRPGTSVPTPSI